MAQIKRPLCCRIFQPFEDLAKKEPAAWQDCHIAGSNFCHPDKGYFFAGIAGLEKYLKKSLSGLSTIVDPPDPKACL